MNILRSAAAQTAIENSSNQNLFNQQQQNNFNSQTSNFVHHNHQPLNYKVDHNNNYLINRNYNQQNNESAYNNNNNNQVDYDMKKFQSDISDLVKSNMKLTFEQFDKDMDGRISFAELNFVMRNLFPDEDITEQHIKEMLHAADLDKNGSIEFEGK